MSSQEITDNLLLILFILRVGTIAVLLAIIASQVETARHSNYEPSFGSWGMIGIMTFLSVMTVWWTLSVLALVIAAVLAIVVPLGTARLRERRKDYLRLRDREC